MTFATIPATTTTATATTATTTITAGYDSGVSIIERFRQWTPGTTRATAAIVAASVAYAAASFFVRRLTDAGLAPSTVALARFALTAAVLVRFVRVDSEHRDATMWGLGSGAAMALGWIAHVRAVEVGSVATAGVVYMTYPLFAMLGLAVLFGVRPTRRQVTGGVLVVVGAMVALGPVGTIPWFAIAAPATFGVATAVLTERLGPLDPFERLGSVATGATVALLPIAALQPVERVVPGSIHGWALIIGLGVGSALVPMLVYAAAAPRIGAATAAVAGSVELPMVIAIGVLLGELITTGQIVGTLLICAAVAITAMTRPAHVIAGEGRPALA